MRLLREFQMLAPVLLSASHVVLNEVVKQEVMLHRVSFPREVREVALEPPTCVIPLPWLPELYDRFRDDRTVPYRYPVYIPHIRRAAFFA